MPLPGGGGEGVDLSEAAYDLGFGEIVAECIRLELKNR